MGPPSLQFLLVQTNNSMVLYMSSSFGLLGVESRDFSQGEKERTACKAEQIHKMTIIFTQNDNLGPIWVKIVVQAVFFQHEKTAQN